MATKKEDELNSRPFVGGGGRFGGGGASASWGGATAIPTTVPNFPQVQQNSGYPVDLAPFAQRPMAMQYRPSTIPSMATVGASMVNNIQPQLPAVPSEPPRIALPIPQPQPQRLTIPPLSPNPQQGRSTAMVRDWSQDPAVAAAMKTGNVAEIEKATKAARDAFMAGGVWAQGAREVPLNPTPALQQRTPEQQQALLDQIRQAGANLARQRIRGQEDYFAQKRAEKSALQSATVEAYRSGATPQSVREARQAYLSQQPSSIAGIQKQYATMAPNFNLPMAERTAFVREPFKLISGGPQPQQSTAAAPPIIPERSLGLTAESPLAFTPFGRKIGESPYRTPEIPQATGSPFPRNIAQSITSPLGIPRFPYLLV